MYRTIRSTAVIAFLVAVMAGMTGCGGGGGMSRNARVDQAEEAVQQTPVDQAASEDSTEPAIADQPQDTEFTDDSADSRAAGFGKGIQAILLSNWHPNSVGRFLDVFRDGQGRITRGPSKIELAFAPYIYGSRQPRYQNAESIMGPMTAAGKKIAATVYLSFHAASSADDAKISANAADFNLFLRRHIANGNLTFSVSPSLEDNASDSTFKRWAGLVASKIDRNLVGRVYLRRSIGSGGRALPSGTAFKGAEDEFHGPITNAGKNYSNDGNFVYYVEGREDSRSMINTNNPPPQYPLTGSQGFIAKTASISHTVNIWRPAYNVFVRRADSRGRVTFDYNGRRFDNSCDSFDASEKSVLKLFLGIP